MMKLKHISSWAVLVLLSFFVACNDEDDKADAYLNADLHVSPLSARLDADRTTTIAVDYTGSWKASLSDTTWCSLDKNSGRGKGEITVSLKPGLSPDVKTTKLIVRATDAVARLHVVELLLAGEDFYADPITVEFGLGDGSGQTVDVVCDGRWSAELSDNSWCSLDKSSGEGNGQLTITSLVASDDATERSTELIIRSIDKPGLTTRVNVKLVEEFKHGSCLTLQKATKGKGINLIFMGDGFIKEEMGKNGYWQQTMEKCLEKTFKYEPLISFREYFNVYAVAAVSDERVDPDGGIANNFFGLMYREGRMLTFKPNCAVDAGTFAYEHSPAANENVPQPDVTVLLVANANHWGGVAYVRGELPSIGTGGLWDGIGDFGVQDPDPLATIVTHEFIGHAFGKLADQYIENWGMVPNDYITKHNTEREMYGFWQNIDFTKDPTKFYNKNWLKLLEMGYPGAGIYEGALYYEKGVWRNVLDDAMRNSDFVKDVMPFGPVNRELIVRRIYKLAGMESEYSLDVFLEYDKKNKNILPSWVWQ